MPRCISLLSLVVLINFPLFAQIAVGQWRDHLPYNQGVKLADAGDWIFAASQSGLFQYHKTEGDIVRLSKVSGLSDIGFSSIAWSNDNATLIIAYTNTNIDLIQDGQIINVPDIKDKSILGLKTINDIHVDGDYAYLACGFAIVVLDIVKHEIKDTYYIGTDGSSVNVHDVTTSGNKIFASTENGVYHASLNSANLANFENWTIYTDIPTGEYSHCTWFNERLYVSWSRPNALDSIYWMQNGQWFPFDVLAEQEIKALESTENRLIVTAGGSASEYDANHERYRLAFNYDGVFGAPSYATIDDDMVMWISDRISGLVRHPLNLSFQIISVNGPSASSSTGISIWDGRCYVASGSLTPLWGSGYNSNGLYTYKENEWRNIRPASHEETSTVGDVIRVLVDPFDSKRVYATAWNYGVLEYYDDQFVAWYDTTNSPLEDVADAPGYIKVSGMEIDRSNGTLWVAGAGTTHLLYAKDQSGSWFKYSIPGIGNITLGDIAIDNSGQKWVVAPRGVGLIVYNDGGTLSNTNDDQSRKLTQSYGNGNLASNTVYSIASDFDGEIWVGTDNGISVFYSPESVFSGGNFDSQQILVEQDGYVQYLLENESVTAIAVDGANRKWIGTASAGVFLMSDDGTEEILHFTKDNSPLFSNQITALGIDHLSGEVFIGTDKGMISYKGTATWGVTEIEKEDVYAYPNPVEPGYDGPIAIKGLVRDADVKIADASGRVVYTTTAYGGQAIWDGNNLSGERAQSGVYLVFATNEDGKETIVTKVLFIN